MSATCHTGRPDSVPWPFPRYTSEILGQQKRAHIRTSGDQCCGGLVPISRKVVQRRSIATPGLPRGLFLPSDGAVPHPCDQGIHVQAGNRSDTLGVDCQAL
jgi:hypothetical protein